MTGSAGFIGSNLCATLLACGQDVIGIDNFSNGYWENIRWIEELAGDFKRSSFQFVEGDIRDPKFTDTFTALADIVLHQAALGSVPRSIANPVASFESNVVGFHNLVDSARRMKHPPRLVFASSSSVYGDSPNLPKVEGQEGNPLSPYAMTKHFDEKIGQTYSRVFGLPIIGLRYFNVFGPRQKREGPYAAVIPLWISALLQRQGVNVNGDGSNSRDFTFIANVVQANLLAALTPNETCFGEIFNIAAGGRTTLLDILDKIISNLKEQKAIQQDPVVQFGPPRAGDVPHSLASIEKASKQLQYSPLFSVDDGIRETVKWFAANTSY